MSRIGYSLNEPSSLVYVNNDRIQSADFLINLLWNKIEKGGIMHTYAYGSHPNCLPITALYETLESRIRTYIYAGLQMLVYFFKNQTMLKQLLKIAN